MIISYISICHVHFIKSEEYIYIMPEYSTIAVETICTLYLICARRASHDKPGLSEWLSE